MEIEFEVTRMTPICEPPANGWQVVASFDVSVFPFKLWDCQIKRGPSGVLRAALRGKRQSGVSITPEELRDAIRQEAIAVYRRDFANGPRT